MTQSENYGNIIQNIANFWQTVKTEKQYNDFVTKIKETKFGTYGTIPFLKVMENFEIRFINKLHEKEFKKEIAKILK
jgi:hypothetical protein